MLNGSHSYSHFNPMAGATYKLTPNLALYDYESRAHIAGACLFDANGHIFVVPGDHLAGIPDYRFKAGAEYQITVPWKFGADLNAVGSQYLIGDEPNQSPKVPAYWVVNVHSSYEVSDHLELFELVKNLFDRHHYVYGSLFDVTSFPYLNLTDPRTFVPRMPIAAYAGLRATL